MNHVHVDSMSWLILPFSRLAAWRYNQGPSHWEASGGYLHYAMLGRNRTERSDAPSQSQAFTGHGLRPMARRFVFWKTDGGLGIVIISGEPRTAPCRRFDLC